MCVCISTIILYRTYTKFVTYKSWCIIVPCCSGISKCLQQRVGDYQLISHSRLRVRRQRCYVLHKVLRSWRLARTTLTYYIINVCTCMYKHIIWPSSLAPSSIHIVIKYLFTKIYIGALIMWLLSYLDMIWHLQLHCITIAIQTNVPL